MTEDACRQLVWQREGSRDRATGQLLERTHDDPRYRGEVHHLRGRRVRPEWARDPDHQILLSAANHRLATGVWGGKLLKLRDPDNPDQPATDATKPILFIRVDPCGRELWRRLR